MIFVTGGSGFIGSNFIINWLRNNDEAVLNIDKLTYAGNPDNLREVNSNSNYLFKQVDICDQAIIESLFQHYKPRAILHFAAESHVDRSIHSPSEFIQTNIQGTFSLLQVSLNFWKGLSAEKKDDFRFLHVSTDEVYGTLEMNDPAFSETTQYAPNSPYSASKAASDHLVRAFHHTYGLPVLTTNCSNNYGPRQFPEKLIPLMISNALSGKDLPIYGDGSNVRDWLFVDDHCRAIELVLKKGFVGQTYNIGGWNEKRNIEIVDSICLALDKMRPRIDGKSYREQKAFVADRPGHDKRYAINAGKIKNDLGWTPDENFESGLEKTVQWYLNNEQWVLDILNGKYREEMQPNIGDLL